MDKIHHEAIREILDKYNYHNKDYSEEYFVRTNNCSVTTIDNGNLFKNAKVCKSYNTIIAIDITYYNGKKQLVLDSTIVYQTITTKRHLGRFLKTKFENIKKSYLKNDSIRAVLNQY